MREEIDVDAPVERVFEFFDDLANAPLLVPAFVEIVNIESLANGGRHVEYTTRNRHGDLVDATSDHVDYDPPHRTVTRSKQSGIETTSTREFVANTVGGTRVVATVEWSVPVKYVSAVVSLPLRGPLRRALRTSLAAAKSALDPPSSPSSRSM